MTGCASCRYSRSGAALSSTQSFTFPCGSHSFRLGRFGTLGTFDPDSDAAAASVFAADINCCPTRLDAANAASVYRESGATPHLVECCVLCGSNFPATHITLCDDVWHPSLFSAAQRKSRGKSHDLPRSLHRNEVPHRWSGQLTHQFRRSRSM